MPIFKINNSKLEPISEKKIDLERDIQKLTEQNLETVFGLKFVCGASNQEFCVRVNDQDFYIDTVAFDGVNNAVIIIEYKKDRSFSVIDQGFAYLAAVLDKKESITFEIRKRLNKDISPEDINWDQTRIYFVSTEYTNYQKSAINFKDLPLELYQAKKYDNDTIEYIPIKANRTSESINKFLKDKKIQKVAKEINVCNLDDHLKNKPQEIIDLFQRFKEAILNLGENVNENVKKYFIAYRNPRLNFITFHILNSKLQMDVLIDDESLDDHKNITSKYPKSYGYAKNLKKFDFKLDDDFGYAMYLIKQSYDFNNGRWE